MARRLQYLFVAAVLLVALSPAARADWVEMVYYQDLVEAGGTVYGYAYTDLGYPFPSNPCPVYYYVYDCWMHYTAYASADLYKDGMWRTGRED